LDQHHADEGEGDEDVQGEQEFDHVRLSAEFRGF
jgi:hypothetical protein